MATRHAELSDLTELELRYLRKAIRYRLNKRQSRAGGSNTNAIPMDRRREIDAIADWILQEKC
jgi:hypothetical protein